MQLQGHHQIGFATRRDGTDAFQARNPATGEDLEPLYTEAVSREVDHALELAVAAHPVLKKRPRPCRAELLERIADEIEALGDELLDRAASETALALPRLAAERARTTGQLRLFAVEVRDGAWLDARIDRADPARTPLPKPDVRSIQQALGPVVVFGASNFPLAFSVAGGDTASALAAGCPVVVKAHPHHPGTSELTAHAIVRAVQALDLPAGTFSLLHGRGHELGAALVRDPRVRAVGFTGSLAGGKALFDLAMARPDPIPVYAEMGSTNPVFLLPEALSARGEDLATGLVGSVTLGVGQYCTNPGLVVALEGEATERFAQHLGTLLDEADAGTMLHAGIRAGYAAGLEERRAIAGVETLTRRETADREGTVRPVALRTDVATLKAHPELADELFGPSTLLVTCSSAEDVLDLARGLHGQLTATIHATPADLEAFGTLPGILEERAGRLVFSGFPTGVEVCAAMHHGGPFPATTAVTTTSVGTRAIRRFTRPICYQNAPPELLPAELRDETADVIPRLIDGKRSPTGT